MALFIDQGGYPTIVEFDLNKILGDDNGGLGDTPVHGNPTVNQITYNQSMNGFGQDLINALVNTFMNPTVITGVDSSYQLFGQPGQPGQPIANFGGGISFVDSWGINRVIYDVLQCGLRGYFCYDTNGSRIIDPGFIILGHELSHVFHNINGDVAANSEVQARTDENYLRAQYILPLRDVNNVIVDCGDVTEPPPNNDCFIASAAYGSPSAPQVNKFRELRDIFLSQSILGGEFFSNLYDEYYQFSPQIAEDMSTSPTLKSLVSKLVVEPLFDFFTLLELYVREGWKQEQKEVFKDEVKRILMRSIEKLPDAGLNQDQIESIYLAITRMKARLNGKRDIVGLQKVPSPIPACNNPELILDYLANTAEVSAPSIEYVVWAVMEPLASYWSVLARFKSQQGSSLGSYFAEIIDNWLSSAPIPSRLDQFSEEIVRKDLAQLTEILFTIPSVRKKFGTRLIEGYANQVSYDLRTVLQDTGYLPFIGKIKEA